MAKEIETTNDEGETIKETVYTAEEFTAKENELATIQADLVEARRLNVERGDNMKAYSQMSDAEKAGYDANTTVLLKREEELTKQLGELNSKLTDKEKRENESAKNSSLASIHHGDEATKTKLEEKYALLTGMPETTPEEIAARAREAATLAGIQIDPRNPLYSSISGEAPKYKPNQDFTDTDKGKQAAEMARTALGLETPK